MAAAGSGGNSSLVIAGRGPQRTDACPTDAAKGRLGLAHSALAAKKLPTTASTLAALRCVECHSQVTESTSWVREVPRRCQGESSQVEVCGTLDTELQG